MKIALISYKNNHQDYIWQTYVEAMQHHIEKIWGWNLAWQKNDFAQALVKYTTDVIMLGGQQIGYIQYNKEPKHLYINMIVLQPDCQSQGLGAHILEKIASIQRNLPIKLKCFRVNGKAYNFYLNNGFKVIETDKNFYTLKKLPLSQPSLRLE